jgi:hypothetical protein
VSIAAEASDAEDAIVRVEFVADGTTIASDETAPYTFNWAAEGLGTHVLTARAVDARGASGTSTAVTIEIEAPPNAPPQVSLEGPAEGTPLIAPASIVLTASASDPDDGISQVEFFAGEISIGVAASSPYTVTWSDVGAGTYTVTARATDASGAAATSNALQITVDAPAPPPPPDPEPEPEPDPEPDPEPPASRDEIVLHASVDPFIIGGWDRIVDATAASGARLQNPNRNASKLSTALVSPTQAFDLAFDAEAGKAYRLWIRGRALNDSYNNDSIFVQFDGSVDAAGRPVWRTNTTSATTIVLEDCSGCGVKGWGWADNGYGRNVLGDTVYFAQSGPQRLRIQMREDGLAIDQVVLSAVKYMSAVPGALKNDTTILPMTGTAGSPEPPNALPTVALTAPVAGAAFTAPAAITLSADASDPDGSVAAVEFYVGPTLVGRATASPYTVSWTDVSAGTYQLTARAIDDDGGVANTAPMAVTVEDPPPPPDPPDEDPGADPEPPAVVEEIVLHAASQAVEAAGWNVTADASAASGARLQNPNANAPKPSAALASPAKYFDITFTAEAGRAYRLWLRGRAQSDSYNNDSVFVQFDGSVDAQGVPMWRIGTTGSTIVVLEDCGGCGVKGWGWADNGYGTGVFGPVVYFEETGPQRIRIQMREDGLGIDQVVLSAVKYLNSSPGATKNDTTIVPR